MIGIAVGLALAAAPLPPAWANWKYARAVAARRIGVTAIVIPPSIYANAQPSLNDLRIIEGNGAPVPFALDTANDDARAITVNGVISDRGFVRGAYTQAVADVSLRRTPYDAVDIGTSAGDFSERVDVDASDDRRTWRTIRTGAPIYDFQQDGLATNTRVTFTPSTARYVRVRVRRATSPFPLTGLRVSGGDLTSQPLRYRVTLGNVIHDAQARTTTAELMGIDEVPVDRLALDSTSPRFARAVDIEARASDGTWQTIASPTFRRAGEADDQLAADLDETQAPAWRIVVHDGDNAPLTSIAATAYGKPRRLYFDAAPGARYRILYGNPVAPAASYDFAQTHPALNRSVADAALSAPVRNATFVSAAPQRPWTERNASLLWIALGIAVLGIGALAIRSVTTPPA